MDHTRKSLRRRRPQRLRQVEPGQGPAGSRRGRGAVHLAHHARAARAGKARTRVLLRRQREFDAMARRTATSSNGRTCTATAGERRGAGDRLAGRAADQAPVPDAVLVFVLPPSWEELRAAPARRGEDTPGDHRAAPGQRARGRVAQARHFDFVIINEIFETRAFRPESHRSRAAPEVRGPDARPRRGVQALSASTDLPELTQRAYHHGPHHRRRLPQSRSPTASSSRWRPPTGRACWRRATRPRSIPKDKPTVLPCARSPAARSASRCCAEVPL
jgi:hypothetical protein